MFAKLGHCSEMKSLVCNHYLISSSNNLKVNIIACIRDSFTILLPLELLRVFLLIPLGAVKKCL